MALEDDAAERFVDEGSLGVASGVDHLHAYGAFSRTGTIRIVDLGDLSVPGPLAPAVLDSIELGAGFNPASTRMGIIAVLIGLVTEQVPAVFFVEDGQTVVLAFDGTEFRPVGLMEDDGIWFFL